MLHVMQSIDGRTSVHGLAVPWGLSSAVSACTGHTQQNLAAAGVLRLRSNCFLPCTWVQGDKKKAETLVQWVASETGAFFGLKGQLQVGPEKQSTPCS